MLCVLILYMNDGIYSLMAILFTLEEVIFAFCFDVQPGARPWFFKEFKKKMNFFCNKYDTHARTMQSKNYTYVIQGTKMYSNFFYENYVEVVFVKKVLFQVFF